MNTLVMDNKIQIRATVNAWVSDNFPQKRKFLVHSQPEYVGATVSACGGAVLWKVFLLMNNQKGQLLGEIGITKDMVVIEKQPKSVIEKKIDKILVNRNKEFSDKLFESDSFKFVHGNGVEFSKTLEDKSIDLLITDPPYGISNPYTCEKQIPRRLRKNGTDFIMPRGHFGDWDYEKDPTAWAEIVLPKVNGWAVIFCAQEQIGEYSAILKRHKFNAVGTFVWQKTNPVPFNSQFKPINAWESMIIGKRPGTKFNAKNVHNIIKYKSPSPQERIHPTQKPVKVLEKMIEYFSKEQDLLLDPFAGSASSVVASINMKRKIIAYEKDIEFYRLAHQRLNNYLEKMCNE